MPATVASSGMTRMQVALVLDFEHFGLEPLFEAVPNLLHARLAHHKSLFGDGLPG